MASIVSRTLLRSRAVAVAGRRIVAPCVSACVRDTLQVRRAAATSLARSNMFSTSSDSTEATGALVDSLDENRFLELAETTLDEIQTWIDGIEEMLDESDVSLSQGVLKIDLGEHGTWVLNRQIPNRQIWWSSPISGPRRYEYDAASGKWLSTRDGTELFERLQDEISEATGILIFQ